MAISADIDYIYSGLKIQYDTKLSMKEAINDMINVYLKKGVINEEGGYVFQVGVWRDHPDFAYPGHTEIVSGLTVKKVDGIGEVTSHSHRHPLFLRNLYNTISIEEKTKVSKILDALSIQFKTVVVSKQVEKFTGVLLNNMDGTNGLYRYKTKKRKGYRPYELSSIMLFGWYCFLPDSDPLFERYLNSFPFLENIRGIYLNSHKRTSNGNILFDKGDFIDNHAYLWGICNVI